MAESEDPHFLPTQPWEAPSQPEPPPEVRLGAAPTVDAGRRRWKAPTPEEVQRSFPQYEIGEILGRGGMGAVYKGWQKSLHRFVAIKILPPDVETESKNYAERFQREARAMARFQHPGIVAVHDAGETPEGLLYFVMEYIQGTDLQKMVSASGRLVPDHALNVAMQVCDALAYAHKHGVIHRDIKPSNIMMESDGTVKVADFGLAKLLTEDASLLTGTHMTMGTPDFMAPEALVGMENVDHRADVYAVGVMLYQMLTGELPRGRFDLPSVHTPGLDGRFDAIVDRAMQKSPDKRYASAVDMRSDLESILATSQTAIRASEDGMRTATAQKPRWPLYAGLAAALAAVAAGALFLTKPKTSPGGPGGEIPPAVATETQKTFATFTKDHPFENSLGMKFVPVPVTGLAGSVHLALFSIWETRVQDYEVFIEEKGAAWPKPHYNGDSEPAVNMTWNEAREFCDWLTEREQKSGQLPKTQRYRLPTDHEWSCAVGLGDREDPRETPEEKNMKIPDVFPWGTAWPPPPGTGNYSGEENVPDQRVIAGYHDDFTKIAPVGSFTANPFGIFDLGGNVHEWCEDLLRPNLKTVVLRGASFVNESRENLRSSYRLPRTPDTRSLGNGFRVVLAEAPAPAAR